MKRKLKVLLVDDEEHCLDTLRFDLERFCDERIEIVGEAQNAVAATALLNKKTPDILFLDIDLPGMNGLDFLDSIGQLQAKLIFTTAHSKYAIPAYKFKAEAFLLKPVNAEELIAVIKGIYGQFEQEENRFIKGKLAINDLHGTTFIPLDQINFCESNDNYCKIHLADGNIKTVSKTLKFIAENITDSTFIRIHQSYLINSTYIKKYLKRDGGSLEMEGGKVLHISQSYKEKVKNYLNL